MASCPFSPSFFSAFFSNFLELFFNSFKFITFVSSAHDEGVDVKSFGPVLKFSPSKLHVSSENVSAMVFLDKADNPLSIRVFNNVLNICDNELPNAADNSDCRSPEVKALDILSATKLLGVVHSHRLQRTLSYSTISPLLRASSSIFRVVPEGSAHSCVGRNIPCMLFSQFSVFWSVCLFKSLETAQSKPIGLLLGLLIMAVQPSHPPIRVSL